jgi:cytochrome c oxidase subunit 2
MRVKQDAIPGMRIPTWFQATKTGTYEVACAQLCGNNHYSMRALMYVQTQSDFDKWLVEKSKPAEEFKD